MEYKAALDQLRDRLDACLKHHADEIDCTDIGDIYRLQAYSETHYYMKAVHDYTPAEVEALLAFEDPLEVAFWCREENTHTVGLPVYEILKEINADERFSKISPEISLQEKSVTLSNKLELNLLDYLGDTYPWDSVEIYKHSEHLAALMAAYRYVTDELLRDNLDESVVNHLLSVDNPLNYLAARWPECTLFGEDVIADIQKEIDGQNDRAESIHDRLKDAQRKAAEQPTMAHGDMASKDKESR